jgi:hypothetical protein
MNISSVGSGAGQFLSPTPEGISQGTFTSVSGELAVLMLDTQEQQKQQDREQLNAARQDFTEALLREVDALREQAHAAFVGACFEGATAVASGGFGIAGALSEPGTQGKPSWQSATSDGLGRLAHPLGAQVGTNYGAADAKSASGAEEAAKWQIDDCRTAIKDADGLQNKALDWASSMSDRDAATTTAILSNKV